MLFFFAKNESRENKKDIPLPPLVFFNGRTFSDCNMDSLYVVIIGILLLAAVGDLIIGVSNDAANFLNSAISSLSIKRYWIFVVASAGVLVGASFSEGMMEVARKGIFDPTMFSFSDIIIIFFAVMVTDLLLLDTFNSLGLPTSTTVSIVFELLGAAIGMAIIKVSANGGGDIIKYINSSKALLIIGGIFFSIVIAFSFGMVVQYFSRFLFSFRYESRFKYLGAIWGGLALSAICYFLIFKGMKTVSFIPSEIKNWLQENPLSFVGYAFPPLALLLGFLQLFRVNILKLIVLLGTFSIAMAFAGNDLVNFIGVPIAALNSYELYVEGGNNPDMLMGVLAKKVPVNTWLLVLAGVIMVGTLWLSKKARKVSRTELSLSQQRSDTLIRFRSSLPSRALVRFGRMAGKNLLSILPRSLEKYAEKQFDPTPFQERSQSLSPTPLYDMIRASVNLTCASIIISYATTHKLPLSTTYVTFMVAMGTSLSDRAWGRESAVHRITGVLSVILGWFVTALAASTCAALIAFLAYLSGTGGMLGMALLVGFYLLSLNRKHKKATQEAEADSAKEFSLLEQTRADILSYFSAAENTVKKTYSSLYEEKVSTLQKLNKKVRKLSEETKEKKNNLYIELEKLPIYDETLGYRYVMLWDNIRDLIHAIRAIVEPSFQHIDNSHKGLSDAENEELQEVANLLNDYLQVAHSIVAHKEYYKIDELPRQQKAINDRLDSLRRGHVKRVKNKEARTRATLLYFDLLSNIENVLQQTYSVSKSMQSVDELPTY